MNDSINPYESPQADLSASPFIDEVKLTEPGLRTTGIGLSLVYYGIVIFLLAFLVIFFSSMFLSFRSNRPGALNNPISPPLALMAIAGIIVVLGGLLIFAGHIVCLSVPSESGAKGLIIAAVALQVLNILHTAMPILTPNEAMPPLWLTIPMCLGGAASPLFFLLFLGKLSGYIGRIDLRKRAHNVLILGMILFGIASVLWGMNMRRSQSNAVPSLVLCLVLLIGGLICFVMYINLINALRKVLLGKATGSSENEDPNSGRLIAAGKRLA